MAACIPGKSSQVPGNIGLARSKVLLWNHDPFVGRAMQNISMPFNDQVSKELDASEQRKTQFVINTVSLKPITRPQNMFVATIIKSQSIDTLTEADQIDFTSPPLSPTDNDLADLYSAESIEDFDYVESPKSGRASAVKDFLPGGSQYVAKDFQHQLWIYVGSLFRNRPTLHPSEYPKALSETEIYKSITSQIPSTAGFVWDPADLQCAVKWEYAQEKEGEVESFWPYMTSKQTPNFKKPVHWSLQKYTKVWQGCDFFIHVKRGDKSLDQGVDQIPLDEIRNSEWESYKYLMYDIEGIPYSGSRKKWFNGINNEAYWFAATEDPNSIAKADEEKHFAQLRKEFWWQYKPYLLIEIGWAHPEHNYFIELVKGRNPRFIHLGKEWDNVNRLQPGSTAIQSTEGWEYLTKSRVLSTYDGLSSDAILGQADFKINVSNNIGKIIITFQGHEDKPWVILRKDRKPNSLNNEKEVKPCIVPRGYLRIHGGNISVKLDFGVITYPGAGVLHYDKVAADTFKATDRNIYMTFSQMGNVDKNSLANNMRKKIFDNDPLLPPGNPTYDCDAAEVYEYIKNEVTRVKVYENYAEQYIKIGKGIRDSVKDPKTGLIKIASDIITPAAQPHRLLIRNNKTDLKFPLGRSEQYFVGDSHQKYSSSWDVTIHLHAGDILMPPGENSPFTDEAKLYVSVLTPIGTQWRLMVTGGQKVVEGVIDPIDISPLVTHISDRWSAEEFTSLNHEATLKCYLPIGTAIGVPDSDDNLTTIAKKLFNLHKQAFYVTIKYWWENGIGLNTVPENKLSGIGTPENDDTLIQMTGIAFGGEMDRSNNKLTMTIKVKDYMEVFKKQFIFNSPFFDGVADTAAIYELAKLAGFDDNPIKGSKRTDRRVLGFLQIVLNNLSQKKYFYNGENNINKPYDLPSGYANLANPAVRFQNGETYDSALKKIAQYAGKTVYFDRYGVLKYENVPAYEVAFASPKQIQDDYKPVYEFIMSPLDKIKPTTDDVGGTILSDGFTFDSTKDLPRLVFNVVKYGRAVEDCVNQIVLMTASKDIFSEGDSGIGGFIIEGHTFFDQLWDPAAEGFLGFRKAFYQSNGVFGNQKGVRNALLHYAKMHFPPTYITFETYGVPGLKALDIVTLNKELFYITEISNEIDPKENKWWMSVQGEWFKPFRGDVDFFGETSTETLPAL